MILKTIRETPVLIMDCQTTGMRPSNGFLLEISWCRFSAGDEEEPEIHSRLLQLPEGESIPWRVQEITGIKSELLVDAISREQLLEEFRAGDATPDAGAIAVIHYAQFEKPWLEDLFSNALPFEIVCTHRLTKKLFPNLPSRNIRGVSGFFGHHIAEVKRARDHVKATVEIWRGLVAEFENNHIVDFRALKTWLEEAPKTKATRYEYKIEKEKRLNLPPRPGIYRMIAKSGDVLYVGKATSLRDRVNSYFRGKKGRDPKKLEMLTQVWDLEFTECGSALEAALLETDEIKRLDPPYNVSLKRGRRKLIFYSRDFSHVSQVQDENHPRGAFRPFNGIEEMRLVFNSLNSEVFLQTFHSLIPEESLRAGFAAFCEKHKIDITRCTSLRSLLYEGVQLYRREKKRLSEKESEKFDQSLEAEASSESVPATEGEEDVITIPEVCEKFERLFMKAGRELWRVRYLSRLLNAKVRWQSECGERSLVVHAGKIGEEPKAASVRFPWRGLDIGDYDRMSVLFSGISPVNHRIEPLEPVGPLES